jgi:acetoin utilization deacetylase AcuC-like enzyme
VSVDSLNQQSINNHQSPINNVRVVYSSRYEIDIGLHVFPTTKYRLVHDRLIATGAIQPSDVVEPPPATWDELGLVHTPEYLAKMRDGSMTDEDLAQLELPWSRELVDGFRVMVGGTILAARLAVDERSIAAHIGGGLHHAFANHGEGFCPFNDVAVAVRALQSRGLERAAIVDLDVHHGNGTAFIFNPGGALQPSLAVDACELRRTRRSLGEGGHPSPQTRSDRSPRAYPEQDVRDARVFTFSMHQQHNYPMWKPRGSLDIGLSDGTHDETFLEALARALPQVIAHRPECVFYLAGADPYEDDQLGGLKLTKDGLRRRDRAVIRAVRDADVPLVIVLAGGYARRVEDTVAIHVATIEEASQNAKDAEN